MTEFTNKILVGNCYEKLQLLPDDSVQCIVTSPPYWGLRDYGLDPVIWGGTSECNHEWTNTPPRRLRAEEPEVEGVKQSTNKGSKYNMNGSMVCSMCGAWLGTFGNEPSPELYVDHFALIAKELWRVLKPDGTFWLNLGDTYAGSGSAGSDYKYKRKGDKYLWKYHHNGKHLKPKDLAGVPWRVALKLQEDGWYLRQDIIWHKKNTMPEPVKDRCTKTHEYIFLLSKSRKYYFDFESIKEPYTGPLNRWGGETPSGVNWDNETGHNLSRKREPRPDPHGRRRRSVWSIGTGQNRHAHFAVFPEELPRNCILAGSREGDIVLDPFGGSGTTGIVAQKLGRNFILIDANEEYAQMAEERIFNESPLFSEVGLK